MSDIVDPQLRFIALDGAAGSFDALYAAPATSS